MKDIATVKTKTIKEAVTKLHSSNKYQRGNLIQKGKLFEKLMNDILYN